MEKNIGNVDKALRVVIGIALLSLLFILEGNARWWGLIGIGPILTVIFRLVSGLFPDRRQYLQDQTTLIAITTSHDARKPRGSRGFLVFPPRHSGARDIDNVALLR